MDSKEEIIDQIQILHVIDCSKYKYKINHLES